MIETLETLRYLNAATKHDFALWETICEYSKYKSFARSRGKANSLVYAAQQANIFKQSLEHKSEMRMQNLLAELSDYLYEACTNEDSDLNKICIYYLQCVQCHIVALWETAATRGIRLDISSMVNEQDTQDYLDAMGSDLCFEELEELSHGKKNKKPKAKRTKRLEEDYAYLNKLIFCDIKRLEEYFDTNTGKPKKKTRLNILAIIADTLSSKYPDDIPSEKRFAIFEELWGKGRGKLKDAFSHSCSYLKTKTREYISNAIRV